MKPQREIRVENENTEGNLSGAARRKSFFSPLCSLLRPLCYSVVSRFFSGDVSSYESNWVYISQFSPVRLKHALEYLRDQLVGGIGIPGPGRRFGFSHRGQFLQGARGSKQSGPGIGRHLFGKDANRAGVGVGPVTALHLAVLVLPALARCRDAARPPSFIVHAAQTYPGHIARAVLAGFPALHKHKINGATTVRLEDRSFSDRSGCRLVERPKAF